MTSFWAQSGNYSLSVVHFLISYDYLQQFPIFHKYRDHNNYDFHVTVGWVETTSFTWQMIQVN